jgi:steroid delta-isomerase-like uncharacterized protein
MASLRERREVVIATGGVHDGPDEVMSYFRETRTAFPDQRNELIALHHTDDAVIAEFNLLGTHLGDLRGLPPTGGAFTCRMLAIFEFEDGGEGIVCERVYFDTATIQRQLGIAHDPLTLKGRLATVLNHPVTIAGAFLRRARKS